MTDNTTNPTIQIMGAETSPCSAAYKIDSILSLEESSLSSYELGRYCCCSGLGVLKSKAAPPLLGEHTSVSIVLPCPDNSMKVSPRFPSLSRTLVTFCALNHLYLKFSKSSGEPLLYYVDLTLLLSAVGE